MVIRCNGVLIHSEYLQRTVNIIHITIHLTIRGIHYIIAVIRESKERIFEPTTEKKFKNAKHL